MAGLYGDNVCKTVRQGAITLVTGSWKPITSNGGVSNLAGRRYIRIYNRASRGAMLGLAYASVNADGTYTTPTDDVRLVTMYPGNSIDIEPVGDTVMVFGRLINKAAAANSSSRVIATEYA